MKLDPIKIVLFNGPPGSGKDTAAYHLAETCCGKNVKFAEPIKRAVTAIYHGGDRTDFNKYDTLEMKGIPQDIYFGKTCRQVQIGVSEDFLKPFHDTAVFGKILAQDITRMMVSHGPGPYFVSDSGFRPEAEVLVNKFGASNIYLARIHREGCDFSNDSRSYISLKDLGVIEFDIENHNDNKALFLEELSSIFSFHP